VRGMHGGPNSEFERTAPKLREKDETSEMWTWASVAWCCAATQLSWLSGPRALEPQLYESEAT